MLDEDRAMQASDKEKRSEAPTLAWSNQVDQDSYPASATLDIFKTRRIRSSCIDFIRSLRPFRGIIRDIRARAPYYLSDWTDAWNYRVIPATLLIFFANVLPGIAFSLDLIETTNEYGVSEVLLSSFMAAFIFSVFGAQPLCIAGVTGPITVFNKTIYNITQSQPNPPIYLHFVGWVYLWGAILHWITAALNWCNLLKYVTRFPCDTFGFFVSWVYLQYGVQIIIRQFQTSALDGAFVQVILALVMFGVCYIFRELSHTDLFHRHARRFMADYGMPIALVATSGLAYWGRFHSANPSTLPTAAAFQPANGRAWLVPFWQLPGKWVGIAFPFGVVLYILFFFDHNVSSLIAQGSEYPLRKPPGFHYDFFLLGITTFIAGLLGLPAPNGLIPQAPIHTNSLLVMGVPLKTGGEKRDEKPPPDPSTSHNEVAIGVVEQRFSNLAQGAICLVLLTGPFLHVLNLIPRGVLAGLFWYMGADALQGNGVTIKLFYLFRDKTLISPREKLRQVRNSRIALFVLVQLLGFGCTFAIVQTIAAIGFPVVILLLIPVRTLLVPRLPFTPQELATLDQPTASAFTMESVGGSL